MGTLLTKKIHQLLEVTHIMEEKSASRTRAMTVRVSRALYRRANELFALNKKQRSVARIVADMAGAASGVDCPEAREWLELHHSGVASSLDRSVDSAFVAEFQRTLVEAQQAAIVALSTKTLDDSETAAVARFIQMAGRLNGELFTLRERIETTEALGGDNDA